MIKNAKSIVPHIPTILILVVAFFLYMVVILPSGRLTCIDERCGLHFFGAHEHDGVWHVAIANASLDSYPFKFPTYARSYLSGYNFLMDYVIYLLGYLGISPWDSYFRLLPILWFAIFTFLLFIFAKASKKGTAYFPILAASVLFSSSFGFIIQLKNKSMIWGSSGTPTMQGALSMVNPQFLWSLCFLIILWLLLKSRKFFPLTGVILFILLGLKFYSVLPAGVLLFVAFVNEVRLKSWKDILIMTASSFAGILLAYLLFYSSNTSSGLIFSPMSLPKQIVEDPNMWHMPALVQSWYTLKESGNIFSPRLWLNSITIILIFIFFNFGIRIVAVLFDVVQLIKRNSYFDIWVKVFIVSLSIIVPSLLIQKGDWWNTIQFLYYGIFFASVSLADVLHSIYLRNKKYFVACALVVFLLSLPANIDIIKIFIYSKSSYIPTAEVNILGKLKNMKDGVVMAQPFYGNNTSILADTVDTAYVSAISGKQTYMADEIQMRLLGLSYEKRMSALKSDPCSLLDGIDYVYVREQHTHNLLGECIAEEKNFKLLEKIETVKLWGRQ